MAKGVTIEVDRNNMKAIDNMFKQLPKEVSKNKTWLKFWRENSKPLQRAAKENAAKLNKSKKGTGQLAKSVSFFTTKKSRKYLGGYVGPRVKGAFNDKKKSGYYGAWVEYGNFRYGKGEIQPWMANAWPSHTQVLANGMRDAEKIFKRVVKAHEKKMAKYKVKN